MSKILIKINRPDKSFTVDELEENREIIINAKTILFDLTENRPRSTRSTYYDSDDDDELQKEIEICREFFESIESLPNCIHLISEKLRLRRLPQLPICRGVNISKNELEELPELPECIGLDCRNNKLRRLSYLPKCTHLGCSNQYPGLEVLPGLPNCEYIDCHNNKLENLPNLPKCRELMCKNNPDLYYPGSVATKFRLPYPSPGNKRHYKEIFNRILNRKRANNAFQALLDKIRMKPSISMVEERRFRNAIANLDLGEEQEQELKSYVKQLPGTEYEKAMKEAGELGMQVDPRITRIRRTASSNFIKYYINY